MDKRSGIGTSLPHHPASGAGDWLEMAAPVWGIKLAFLRADDLQRSCGRPQTFPCFVYFLSLNGRYVGDGWIHSSDAAG